MDTLTIVSLVILTVVTVGIGLLLLRQSRSQADLWREELTTTRDSLESTRVELGQCQQRLAASEMEVSKIPELKEERDEAHTRFDQTREAFAELQTAHQGLVTKTDDERQAATDKLKALEQAEDRLATQFENLANRIFDEKHQKFTNDSKESVENLLAPVKQQLTEFKAKVEEVYREDTKDRTSLLHQIDGLKGLHQQMSADAVNLTRALKGESKTRGNWGEMQLERILEESGLKKGREYDGQASYRSEDGKRQQPDVVVHLPEDKDIVIDSKVSLVAYDAYHRADTDDVRQVHTKDHLQSVRNHINELSGKKYEDLVGVNSLDLVIMFVPIESACLLALESDPGLYIYALDKGILLVSPTTLMGTLQIIHNIWRYEYQNQNVLEIAKQGGGLYDQFVLFAESLQDLGKALEKAQTSYSMARNRLTDGRGNLVGRVEELQKLGAKAKKKIPQVLLKEATIEPDEDSPQDEGVRNFLDEADDTLI